MTLASRSPFLKSRKETVTAFLDLVCWVQPDGLGDVHGPAKRVAGRMIWVVRNPSLARYRAATGRAARVIAPVLRASCSARLYQKDNDK